MIFFINKELVYKIKASEIFPKAVNSKGSVIQCTRTDVILNRKYNYNESQYYIGNCYYYGKNILKDKAIECYLKSSEGEISKQCIC